MRLTVSRASGRFAVIGSNTIRSCNPKKTQVVERALAKLFALEEMGADYEFTYESCEKCDMEYRNPVKAQFKWCPYCGERIKRR